MILPFKASSLVFFPKPRSMSTASELVCLHFAASHFKSNQKILAAAQSLWGNHSTSPSAIQSSQQGSPTLQSGPIVPVYPHALATLSISYNTGHFPVSMLLLMLSLLPGMPFPLFTCPIPTHLSIPSSSAASFANLCLKTSIRNCFIHP